MGGIINFVKGLFNPEPSKPSTDGGSTWGTPVRYSDDTTNDLYTDYAYSIAITASAAASTTYPGYYGSAGYF